MSWKRVTMTVLSKLSRGKKLKIDIILNSQECTLTLMETGIGISKLEKK
jgi:HSP90 family molecular chaperone